MPAPQQTLLITKSDLNDARLIPSSVDDARVKVFIQEAQHLDIRPALGDALFFSLIAEAPASSGTTANAYLLWGKTYTNAAGHSIIFYGLHKALAYYALARLFTSHQQTITAASIVTKTNPNSEPVDAKEKAISISALRSAAVSYWEDTKQFLNDSVNINSYPLWLASCRKDDAKGAIKISAIGGELYEKHRHHHR